MSTYFGPVLTNAPSAASFVANYQQHGFNSAVVVTGWGIDNGWDGARRKLVADNVGELIIRSTVGDPSNRNTLWFPFAHTLVEEFRPWVAVKPNVLLAVGNEPDVVWERPDVMTFHDKEEAIWVYRYWLDDAERNLRREFPGVRLIAPSPRVGVPGWQRWLDIMADVLGRFDILSAHVYGWHRLATVYGQDTDQFPLIRDYYNRRFPGKPVAITEMGIHDVNQPASQKLAHYRQFAKGLPANWRWALFYHYNARKDIDKEYAVLP